MFRIKPHTHQRCSDGWNKALCTPGPRDPTETEPDLPECLSISCRGMGQQWPAMGTWALAAVDLGHAGCGISHLGGDHYSCHYRATKQVTHKPHRTIIPKKVLHC